MAQASLAHSSVWRDAAWGVAAVAALTLALHIVPLASDATVVGWMAMLYMTGLVAIPALVALAVLLFARIVLALPAFYRRAAVATVAAMVPLFGFYATDHGALIAAAGAVIAASLLGAGVGSLLRQPRGRSTPGRRIGAAVAALMGMGFFAISAWWLLDAGRAAKPRASLPHATHVAPLPAPDPSQPGDHPVSILTYGSGTDRYRPEYGTRADLRTTPVDASKLVSWSGIPARIRARYWGFDTDALPLQGRAWVPEGGGPFPLVLAVHGNHLMESFSDAGYAYLGEQLASRGFIFVSVDQNFLNTGLADLRDGTGDENDARGWLLLEHLRQWHEWNADPAHPLHGKLDTDRIALIGHSRGGEAVAVAASFNRLPFYPDDASLAFDYAYGIRAVASIAPVDGQYRPARVGTPLRDVHYLALQGGHDADMTSFDGAKQFDRVRFSDGFEGFKSAVFFSGGNHGQFNTDWGRLDVTRPFGWLLNVRPLIAAQAQRRIAQVYIGAFLEVALRDDRRYLPLLRNPHAGAHWLPETGYASEFVAAGERVVADFGEDIDLSTATLPGTGISQSGLSDWREQRIPLRRGPREASAVYLGWVDADGPPAHYAIALPPDAINESMTTLSFALADTGETPTRPDGDDGNARKPDVQTDDDDRDEAAATTAIDLTIRLTDAAGRTASLPLSRQGTLMPAERPDLFKSTLVRARQNPEPIFQTYHFPLADFAAANPAFDPGAVREIAFVFDRTAEGFVALNRVGFVRGTGEAVLEVQSDQNQDQ